MVSLKHSGLPDCEVTALAAPSGAIVISDEQAPRPVGCQLDGSWAARHPLTSACVPAQ